MTKNKIINIIIDNIKTLIGALVIAVLIRSLIIQPFYIPSSSMEPTLLVGDRIFVSKYTYGYSKHSFPFSPNVSNKRFFSKNPLQGDLVVFKTPADNRTDYIKRLVGLPGDEIQFINGNLYINESLIPRRSVKISEPVRCGDYLLDTDSFIGVSNTNDTKRTSIKQQQQEEIKLHSQVEIGTTSSADSEAKQTNVSCSISSVSQQAVAS